MALGIRLVPALIGVGWLALGACQARPSTRSTSIAATSAGYRVALCRAQRDYRLSAPTEPGELTIRTSASEPVEKSKLVFDVPLIPGRYRLALEDSSACGEQTIVLSVPLSAGHYEFEVSSSGCARYDLAFHDARPSKEYRYTLHAPQGPRTFRLEIPQHS